MKEKGLVPLLTTDGYINFLIKIDDDTDYRMDFEVFEVVSWECDDANTPSDTELYMTGVIKWDGCSHVYFGEKDETGNQDGYLHLCGKSYWDGHVKLMQAVYALAEKTIKKYDKEVGG